MVQTEVQVPERVGFTGTFGVHPVSGVCPWGPDSGPRPARVSGAKGRTAGWGRGSPGTKAAATASGGPGRRRTAAAVGTCGRRDLATRPRRGSPHGDGAPRGAARARAGRARRPAARAAPSPAPAPAPSRPPRGGSELGEHGGGGGGRAGHST